MNANSDGGELVYLFCASESGADAEARTCCATLEHNGFKPTVVASIEQLRDAVESAGDGVVVCVQRELDQTTGDVLFWAQSPEVIATIVFAVEKPAVTYVASALRQGAHDVVDMSADQALLIAAVDSAVRAHKHTLASRKFARAFRTKLTTLSDHENDVLELILSGATNQRIAGELKRGARHVEITRRKIMVKLDCFGTVDLLRRVFVGAPERLKLRDEFLVSETVDAQV